jgi:hypothetical protein
MAGETTGVILYIDSTTRVRLQSQYEGVILVFSFIDVQYIDAG